MDANSIVLELIKGAVKNVASEVLTKPIADRPSETAVATKVANQLKTDPIFVNETNSEPAVQSRVFWGSIVAALSGLSILVGQFAVCQFGPACYITNWGVVSAAGAAVLGGVYALYGRFASGLKPIGQGAKPSIVDAPA